LSGRATARVELFVARRGGVHEALRISHRADVEADVGVVDDQLRGAAADVEHERAGPRRHPAAGGLGLLAAPPRARPEAVAPLDLAEERLAVLGVADGARRHGERAFRSEALGCAAIVGKHVSHPRDRDGEEALARVDALAKARDVRLAMHLVDATVV